MTFLRENLDGRHRVSWRVWRGAHRFFMAISALSILSSSAAYSAESAVPRTISDITALLDQHKPDPAKVQELKLAATREPPTGADKEALANFYYERAQAAQSLGMVTRQMEDSRRARDLASEGSLTWRESVRFLRIADEAVGNFANALKSSEDSIRRASTIGQRLSVHAGTVRMHLAAGDITTARLELQRAQTIVQQLRQSPQSWANLGDLYISQIESARAIAGGGGKISRCGVRA